MCHNEDGHMELIGADVRIRVSHLERPSSHQHGASFLDGGRHVLRSLQGVHVGMEPIATPARVGNKAIE